MATLSERDKEIIWHPYTQMHLDPESIGIVRGEGAWLFDEQGKKYMDAISSWWVNLHGHAHPYIAEKISQQALTLEHCIFAGFTHEPAVTLAEKLLQILPDSMSRIFYSDNGSTAVEVALKMAFQYHLNTGSGRKKILALQNAYHGDTFGAMSVSGRGLFTAAFDSHLFDVQFIPFPGSGKEEESIKALKAFLSEGDIAAFIVEPLVQGSAGMQMYSPEVLEQYFQICRQHDTLIIADEVMTGFGRTGRNFACDHIKIQPDIICLSKGLTGGTLPLGVTACSRQVYEAFLSDDRHKTFFHGHSYTANPLACAAASASYDLLIHEDCRKNLLRIEEKHKAFASRLKGHPAIQEVRHCGTILVMELLTTSGSTYLHSIRDVLYRHFLSKGILLRPLGNVLYILPPYCISDEDLEYIYGQCLDLFNTFDKNI